MKEFFWILLGALIAAAVGTAMAQRGPSEVLGCIMTSTPPTYTAAQNGQAVPLSCDTSGKVRVNTT